jgi:DNA-binding transcriptional ArsR family regulator
MSSNGDQLELPGVEPVARSTDPGTSWAAAHDATPKAPTHRARVLQALRSIPGGLTDYELAELVGLQQNSAGKRRGELRDAGLVEDSGRRRPAPSGSKAIVWKVVE